MPAFCGVINCGNRADRDRKHFFRLPAVLKKGSDHIKRLSEERRSRWLTVIKRADLNESKQKWFRICEDHFITGKPAQLNDADHPDWVPSKNMGYDKTLPKNSMQRHERLKRRKLELIETSEPASDEDQLHVSTNCDDTENSVLCETDLLETSSVACQTDMSFQDLNNLEEAYRSTIKDLVEAKDQTSKLIISESTFQNDEEKTKYYTGFVNFSTLLIIFNILKQHIPHSSTSSLTQFQQFILTLMRLRLNLDFTDLAYRFCISKPTASRAFNRCLTVMHVRLQKFLFWPDRENLMTSVPNCFLEAFGSRVTVIIDCFEIFIERPSNLMASAQTWSNYKHHNTVKFLVGISPQGTITFISPAWGGRTSDQHIVQNCGILDNLLPGDVVLCDRGFNIRSDVELYLAEVKIPAFTKGKKQLSALEVEESRNISRVRIHVERVIGNLRQKYRILHAKMPLSIVSSNVNTSSPCLLNQIVQVCCCLLNISPSIMSFD